MEFGGGEGLGLDGRFMRMLRCLRFWLVVRVACGLFGRAGGVGSGKWEVGMREDGCR